MSSSSISQMQFTSSSTSTLTTLDSENMMDNHQGARKNISSSKSNNKQMLLRLQLTTSSRKMIPSSSSSFSNNINNNNNCGCSLQQQPSNTTSMIMTHSESDGELSLHTTTSPLPSFVKEERVRRTIFGDFWEKTSMNRTPSLPMLDNVPVSILKTNTATNTRCSNNNNRKASVRFNPRVQVTKICKNRGKDHRWYNTSCGSGTWYTEAELEGFKQSTLALARDFLGRHPELAKSYNESYYDPLTRTVRRRVLFGLPILNGCLPNLRILLYDSNPVTRDLLRRGLRTMCEVQFDVEIVDVGSPLAARRQLQQSSSFDWVVAEAGVLEHVQENVLRIGVCTDRSADLVWSKPPPRMGGVLLKQLVKRMMKDHSK